MSNSSLHGLAYQNLSRSATDDDLLRIVQLPLHHKLLITYSLCFGKPCRQLVLLYFVSYSIARSVQCRSPQKLIPICCPSRFCNAHEAGLQDQNDHHLSPYAMFMFLVMYQLLMDRVHIQNQNSCVVVLWTYLRFFTCFHVMEKASSQEVISQPGPLSILTHSILLS